MNNTSYYQIKRNVQQFPDAIRLRYREWEMLLKLDGEEPVEKLGAQIGLHDQSLAATVSKLQASGLIERVDLSYDEYKERKAKPGGCEEAPPPVRQARTSETEQPSSSSILPLVPVDTVFAAPATSPVAVEESRVSLVPGRKMSLKRLMEFIIRHVGGEMSDGQLMVYRIFMLLEPNLIKRNNITSLRFKDDKVVEDAELEAALIESVAHAMGVKCPDYIFIDQK